MNRLRKMLDPRSVALIGATDRAGSIGRAVFENLLKCTDRPLYPVNPGRRSILDVPCHASIKDVPSPVDLAVIAVPAPGVPAIVDECGQAGVSGAVILSSGFSDAGPRGKRLEGEIMEIRRRHGLRIIGPNSLGVILPRAGLNASFLAIDPRPGDIALISHALGEEILDRGGDVGVGFSMFASLGSMIDVGFGDIIDLLSDDYNTRSIMIYMENVGDARRFISAARGFALRKPIAVLKPGRSKGGSRSITARIGRKAGDDRVYDAVFKRVGMVRVKEMWDLFNMAEVLDTHRLPAGPRLAVITNDWGVGIVAADALEELEGELAELSGKSMDALDSLLSGQWNRGNPVDIMGDADTDRYANAVRACSGDKGVDGVLVIYTPRGASDAVDVAGAIAKASAATAKPVIAVCMGGRRAAKGRQILFRSNVPAYATPEEAVRTYLYMYKYRRNIELLYETPSEVTHRGSPAKDALKKMIERAARGQKATLDVERSFDLVRHYGIPVLGIAYTGAMMMKLGSERDPEFKTVIKLGRPGEEDRDVSIGLPPLNRTLARRMIEGTKAWHALKDDREGRQAITRLEDVLVNFSSIVVDFAEIGNMELVISIKGTEVFASDVNIEFSRDCRPGPSAYPHLVIAPYPSHYIRKVRLRDKTEVMLRPIRPEDEAMGREMLTTLSEETLRVRFFGVPRIDHGLLLRFCNIDYDREIAIYAQIEKDGKKVMIGGARLINEPVSGKGQFAVLVHDDYQGIGLGEKLMEVIISIAREKKLGEIYGVVLTENEKMLALCVKLGFKIVRGTYGESTASLSLVT